MAPPTTPSFRFMDSLRVLGDDLFETVQDRIRLLSIELQEEKFRLIQTFVWISVVVFAGMMTAIFASVTLLYLLWETAPLAALGGLTLFYSLVLTATILRFRHLIGHHPQPFAATFEELGADRTCIRSPN